MDIKDWIQIGSTILLAGTAFIAPYLVELWKYRYNSPVLKINFELSRPLCHQTKWHENDYFSPVYYFRFIVENTGKTQAEECEVFLEKIYKDDGLGKMIEFKNFTPANLKWSGLRDPFSRKIQPGKKMICDIGRIHHPHYHYTPDYREFTPEELSQNKFVFEHPERYYSQWDCLVPGKYKINVAVYCRNAQKITREFSILWSGKWKDSDIDMFKELIIS